MVAIVMPRARRAALTSEPNVVPFIDVLLVLLVVFMVTAPMPTVDHRTDVQRTSPAPAAGDQKATIVQLRDVEGAMRVFVDEIDAPLADLPRVAFEQARRNNPALELAAIYSDAQILVRADQGLAYGNVVMVMDELRLAHFERIGIYAEAVDEG